MPSKLIRRITLPPALPLDWPAILRQGYTRTVLAEWLSISQPTLRRFLSGESQPTYAQGLSLLSLLQDS